MLKPKENMALECALKVLRPFKPHLLMFLVQMGYSSLYFLAEAAFNYGLNPHVYVTYRFILGGLFILPFAYLLERNLRPKLTFSLLAEIFLISLPAVSLSFNMYFMSMKYTSPTFVAAILNTIQSLTFIIAVVFRLEVVDIRNARGIAKVLGTLTSCIGAMITTFYRGAIVHRLEGAPLHISSSSTVHENWLRGSILAVASCISWSFWYIMQAFTLKRYPAPLSLAAWVCFIGGAQSAFFTIFVQHKASAWTIKFNISFWAITVAGVIGSGLNNYLQLWGSKKRGPIFVTMFNPLSTTMVAIVAYFLFGEFLHIGSVMGGVIVMVVYIYCCGAKRKINMATSRSYHLLGRQVRRTNQRCKVMLWQKVKCHARQRRHRIATRGCISGAELTHI